MGNYGVKQVIRLSGKNVGVAGAVECFPLYVAMFL
jgi:hypothetical protein